MVRTIFPPSCVGCGALVEAEGALCGTCWRGMEFISGPICDRCGVPILSLNHEDVSICEDCSVHERPWHRGRSAFVYAGRARDLVLKLKHGDRPDIAISGAKWLAAAGRDVLSPDVILVPVPLHWRRLMKRRYNQAALLAQELASIINSQCCLTALNRSAHTKPLEGLSQAERFARLSGRIGVSKRHADTLRERHIVLIDDVMTSGATLAAATDACKAAGATQVDVLVLARVVRESFESAPTQKDVE